MWNIISYFFIKLNGVKHIKFKTCVYAISKNEEKFVNRWYESIKQSDYICVLDTGSTDKTVEKLKQLGVKVKVQTINPWRFDEARNESLKMIPNDTDICICLDLDEVMCKNWKNELNKVWSKDIDRLQYIYNWKLDDKNKPLISFYADKIHSYGKYKWINAVHEVLINTTDKNENTSKTDKIIINHYPDDKKSRSSYLELLEQSVVEDPNNDRNVHYLGREYMYYKRWNESIDTLIKHLNLKSSKWKDERCASMRYISRCYINLNRYDEANMWLNKAINEAPYLRDGYVEKMLLLYNLKQYKEAIEYGLQALEIKTHEKTYINEIFSWDETIYDVLSICYYKIGKIEKGLIYLKKAIEINPNSERLNNNLIFFKTKNNN